MSNTKKNSTQDIASKLDESLKNVGTLPKSQYRDLEAKKNNNKGMT